MQVSIRIANTREALEEEAADFGPDERRGAIAAILARGLLRLMACTRAAPERAALPQEAQAEDGPEVGDSPPPEGSEDPRTIPQK